MKQFMSEREANYAFTEFHWNGDEFLDGTDTCYQVIAYWGCGCKHLTHTYDPVRLDYICEQWREMFDEADPCVDIVVTRIEEPLGMDIDDYDYAKDRQDEVRFKYLDTECGEYFDKDGYYLEAAEMYWGWSEECIKDALEDSVKGEEDA